MSRTSLFLRSAIAATVFAVWGLNLVLTTSASSLQASPANTPAGARPSEPGQGSQSKPESRPASGEPETPSTAVGDTQDAKKNDKKKEGKPETRVKDIYNFEYPKTDDPDHEKAAIDDIVVLKIDELRTLANQSKCLDEENQPLAGCEQQGIVLFLDGRKFEGNTVEALDVNTGEMQFHLRRTPENNEKWSDLLGNPPLDHRFFARPTAVSVGLANGSPVATDVKDFRLIRISRGWFWTSAIGAILLMIAFVQLAIKSDILRDAGQAPTDAQGRPLPKSFSLSRFQMAFWFILVIASYVFIWLITDATDTLNTSVLALIGIGSGTALGSFAVDAGKTRAAPSEGFLQDILSDATGVCFYRFQMFIWTLVLGMIFISSVWYSLTMPEFSATLLALQGISAGTYMGFKIPEKPSPATGGAGAPAGAGGGTSAGGDNTAARVLDPQGAAG